MEVNGLGGSALSSGLNPLAPGILAGSMLDQSAALESNDSLMGVLSAIGANSNSAFKEEALSAFSEIAVNATAAESEAISSSSETAWNELSGLSQTFLMPFTATRLASSTETVDEASTPDPLTRVAASAQQVGAGNIQVTSPNLEIVKNRMVFSTVNEERRLPKTLTITNTGSGDLAITGLRFGNGEVSTEADFELVNPTQPFTLAAGASRDLSVRFGPKGIDKVASLNTNDSPTHTKNGEQYDSLVITSNDPDQATVTVNLAGLNSANYEGDSEPALAEIARTFGWKTNVGKEDNVLGGSQPLLGDEVSSAYWLRADTTKPVALWPLAVYGGRGDTLHDNIRFEAKPGSGGNSGLIYELAGRNNDDSPTGTEVLGSNNLSGGENQKLLPKIFVDNDGDGDRENVAPRLATVDFTPTKAFALNRGGAWTADSKNGSQQLHNWRIYPVKGADGQAIPNTWLAAVDPGNTEGFPKNYDYNDDVYLMVNAKPEPRQQAPTSYRLDTGTASGFSYTDTSGKTWSSDAGLTNGIAEPAVPATPEITNTSNDTLYHTYRGKVQTLNYNLPISTPKVDVYLHFAELYWGVDGHGGGVGSRVFDVTAEGALKLDDFDITQAAGGPRRFVQRAFKGIRVSNDGILNLKFTASKDFPAISAISVQPSAS